MNIEEAREYVLKLPWVTEDMPFGPDVLAFRVGGKIFMAIGLNAEEPKVTVKLEKKVREEYDKKNSSIDTHGLSC